MGFTVLSLARSKVRFLRIQQAVAAYLDRLALVGFSIGDLAERRTLLLPKQEATIVRAPVSWVHYILE